MSDIRIFWAIVPLALFIFFGRRLPSRLWSAVLASALAGIAAGGTTMGVLFSVMGFFGFFPAAPDPGQIIVMVVVGLLIMIHWAMIKAEAGAANYVIGKAASYSAPHREYYALVGAAVGHAIWFYVAYRYMNPSYHILRDEFSSLFLEMIIPSALLAAPGAALGALFAPKA